MLILVRHGIRGIENINSPFFAPEDNLSFFGQIYSYKLGKYIRRKYGVPTLIYPDNNTERTISTGIAIAKGCKVNKISLAVEVPDPLFSEVFNFNLENIRRMLLESKKEIDKLADSVGMTGKSDVHLKGGKIVVSGLLKDLAELSNVPSFSKLSKTENSLSNKIEKAFSIKEKIIYSDVAKDTEIMGKINTLLKKEKLSVLIGHDETNIALLSLYFGKEFSVPGYESGYVPPNSGFIFLKEGDFIRVEIIYLSTSGKFFTIPYLSVSPISSKSLSELKTLNI